jgi:hypothetical protein
MERYGALSRLRLQAMSDVGIDFRMMLKAVVYAGPA